ncbi:hypothetical protein [Myxosarcina sp. GI1(2024)]
MLTKIRSRLRIIPTLNSSTFNRSILIIAIAFINIFLFIAPVAAATQTFQWQGAKGYVVRGTFEYDENGQPQPIAEEGAGQTERLQSLTVSFYDPTNKLIDTYKNVNDGLAKGNYFEFHFDPTTQQLMGNIDLGGEFAGETYLKGTVGKELSLIEVEPSGAERILDRDFS